MLENGNKALSRRGFILAAVGGAFALLDLSGCQSRSRGYYSDLHSGEGWHDGYSVDAEYCDDPVTICVYADECVQRQGDPSHPFIESVLEGYGKNRPGVTVNFNWCTVDELERFAAEGLPADADAVIAENSVVKAAADAGYVFEGVAYTSVRELTGTFSLEPAFVRKTGSKVDLPAADTIDGNDKIDANEDVFVTRTQKVPEFDGRIAVAGEDQRCGVAARKALSYKAGLYSEESGMGGTFAKSIRKKMAEVADAQAVVDAVLSGECELGLMFACDAAFLGRGNLEVVYEPPSNYGITFDGGSAEGSELGGVARDFLQFLRMRE